MRAFRAPLAPIAALLLTFCARVQAQFYAPDTEYHDRVQRVFVVEAARVLAWLANREETNIHQVTFQLATRPDGGAQWEIHWFDNSHKTLRSASVGYSPDTLRSGPTFYRNVMTQLRLADWKGLPPLKATDVVTGYWRGASKMGFSREQGLAEALKILPRAGRTADDSWGPEMAGLLTHADLPATAGAVSIDPVLLARGAAWLAACEAACGTELDSLWPPILFQAGREQTARELWNRNYAATFKDATPQQNGWNIWLRKPLSKDVFVFATEAQNLPMAMPMLACDGTVNLTAPILAELLEPLAGGAGKLPALQNYAPFFAVRSSVSGGRILEGAWPVYWRLQWLGLLSRLPASGGEFSGYLDALQRATNSWPRKPKPDDYPDASLIGFRETAPLVKLGLVEGKGILNPVAAVTARDLLNYGWEMTGLQMGSRFRFVGYHWGVPEIATPIEKEVTSEIPGLLPFFQRQADAHSASYRESLLRLQLVEGLQRLVGYSPPPFGPEAGQAESARLFVKRCWLRAFDFNWQAGALWEARLTEELTPLIEAFQDQGGPSSSALMVDYLDSIGLQELKRVPRGDELKNSMADNLPEPTTLTVKATYYRDLARKDSFARGRMVEKLYWQNPDSGLELRAFRSYVTGGAYRAARRFYTQARENFVDPVLVSSEMGKMAFVLGFLLNDTNLQAMAIEDSASGSQSDMIMHVWQAATQDDPRKMEQPLKEIAERYESGGGENTLSGVLLKFLPLVPALADPHHPSRRRAIEYFGRDQRWLVLRWILIEKYKLPANDAVVFLGGEESDLFQMVLIRYLQNNPGGMLNTLTRFSRSHSFVDEKDALAYFLYHKLIHHQVSNEDEDLRPPNVVTIRQAVLRKLEKSRR